MESCVFFFKEQVPLVSSLWTWARFFFFFFFKEALHVLSRHFPFSAGWDWASRPPSCKNEIRHIFPSRCCTFNRSSYVFSSPRQCIAVTLGMILPWAPGNQGTNERNGNRTNETGTEEANWERSPTGTPKPLTETPKPPEPRRELPEPHGGQNTVSSQTVSSQIYLEAGEGVGCPL